MKKIIVVVAIATVLFSCNNSGAEKGRFTVTGQLKNTPDQKAYLEELYFGQKDPEVIDTAEVKNGKLVLNGLAAEEGIYRIRLEKAKNFYLFINDNASVNFTADLNDMTLKGYHFFTPANSSFKQFLINNDSLLKKVEEDYAVLNKLQQGGTKPTDSVFIATQTLFKADEKTALKYNLQFADTAKSPATALFAISQPPITVEEAQLPLQKLAGRFSSHNGILTVVNFVKQELSKKEMQRQMQAQGTVAVGSAAPEITMNDVNDKPFSLSQLKGKYVLVDFWASWCGPCRNENPNVVAAYNQFKDKNFTVLGVSLDEDKAAWLKAIKDDGLVWQHISDLKKWKSAVVPLYGIEGIPFNVLLDPQGKVIGTSLTGVNLINKLKEVLP